MSAAANAFFQYVDAPGGVNGRSVYDDCEPNEPFDGNAVNGMALAHATYRALHAAERNLTRHALLDALVPPCATFHGPTSARSAFPPTTTPASSASSWAPWPTGG